MTPYEIDQTVQTVYEFSRWMVFNTGVRISGPGGMAVDVHQTLQEYRKYLENQTLEEESKIRIDLTEEQRTPWNFKWELYLYVPKPLDFPFDSGTLSV